MQVLEVEFDFESEEFQLWVLAEVDTQKEDITFDHEFGRERGFVIVPKNATLLSVRHALTNEPFNINALPKGLVKQLTAKAFLVAERKLGL